MYKDGLHFPLFYFNYFDDIKIESINDIKKIRWPVMQSLVKGNITDRPLQFNYAFMTCHNF